MRCLPAATDVMMFCQGSPVRRPAWPEPAFWCAEDGRVLFLLLFLTLLLIYPDLFVSIELAWCSVSADTVPPEIENSAEDHRPYPVYDKDCPSSGDRARLPTKVVSPSPHLLADL